MCVSRLSIENFNTVSIVSYWSTHVIRCDFAIKRNVSTLIGLFLVCAVGLLATRTKFQYHLIMSWTPKFCNNLYICFHAIQHFLLNSFFSIFIRVNFPLFLPLVKLSAPISSTKFLYKNRNARWCTFGLAKIFRLTFKCTKNFFSSTFGERFNSPTMISFWFRNEKIFLNWLAWRTAKDSKSKETFFRSSIHYINQKYIQTFSHRFARQRVCWFRGGGYLCAPCRIGALVMLFDFIFFCSSLSCRLMTKKKQQTKVRYWN